MNILWKNSVPPDIFEVRFSYDTCRKVSMEHCIPLIGKESWVEFLPDEPLAEILDKTSSDKLLIVNEPELVLSQTALRRLAEVSDSGYGVCGPVYNETPHTRQIADVQYLYYNVTTFLEIAELLAQKPKSEISEVQELDSACVMYRRETLESLDGNLKLSDILPHIQGTKAVDPGAYIHRFANYYNSERDDLARLVPENVRRVLDVGCARGGYGRKLRQLRPDIVLTGVELNPIMAETARPFYDEIITSPIEEVRFSDQFDLINCGDILEHLENPWEMLRRFYELLKIGGYLVTSLPNAGHWSIVSDLLKGKFEYIPVGLLCVTHIRWFTESSIKKALQDAGFSIDIFQKEKNTPTPKGQIFIRDMCDRGYGDEDSLMTHEFTIRAIKK